MQGSISAIKLKQVVQDSKIKTTHMHSGEMRTTGQSSLLPLHQNVFCPILWFSDALISVKQIILAIDALQIPRHICVPHNDSDKKLSHRSLQAKSSLMTVFVNKILVEYSHMHSFSYIYCCFQATAAELHSSKEKTY